MSKSIHWGSPFAASIETVVGCNLLCPGCELGTGKIERSKGIMDVQQFLLVLKKLPASVFHLNLHFQGEPLMNPHITEMVSMARKKRMFVSFSTNAQLLNQSLAIGLIKAGLSHIIISVDGHDSKSYSQYRIGGNFDLLLQNVKQLTGAKKELGSRFPVVEIQTVVMKQNEQHLEEIKSLAKNLGADKFTLKVAHVPDTSSTPDFLPENSKYNRYTSNSNGSLQPKHKAPRFCFRMRSSCVIQHDLNVVPCCFVKNGEFTLGNLSDQECKDILNGTEAQELRKSLQNRCAPEFCNNCI